MDNTDFTSLAIGLIDPADARDQLGWPEAESYRTQGFFRPGPGDIDDKKLIGKWRNLTTDLSAKRAADGSISGEWRLAIDLHVQKWRFERKDAISFIIRNGTSVIYSAVLPGFASKCSNGWVALNWSGPLSGELVFSSNTIELSSKGAQSIERC